MATTIEPDVLLRETQKMAILYFDAAYYLRMNKDVAEAVAKKLLTAEEHFEKYGNAEGRNPNLYFSSQYYTSYYPDIAKAVKDKKTTAYTHFLKFGLDERRDPSAFFDTNYYLNHHPDAVLYTYRNEISAFEHFIKIGTQLNYSASPYFDPAAYLDANRDVRDAVAVGLIGNAYEHLINYGIAENRDLGKGINLAAFKADKVFNNAVFSRNFSEAFARVAQVAPFLETFKLPADSGVDLTKLTIPTDFTPLPGQLLYIPNGVDTKGKTLPGFFISANEPRIVSSTPADDASDANLKADLVITFNKEIQVGSAGTLTLYRANGALVESFKTNSTAIKVTKNQLTINPSEDLQANTGYYVKMDPGFVKDKDGNNYRGILDATTLNFSTGVQFTVSNKGGQITVSGSAAGIVTVDLEAQKINGEPIGGSPSNKVNLAAVLGFGAKITGNDADNEIIGTRYSDTISGGLGADTITGGSGQNVFVFGNKSAPGGKTGVGASTTPQIVTITDWTAGDENRIDFDTDLKPGTVSPPPTTSPATPPTTSPATPPTTSPTTPPPTTGVSVTINGSGLASFQGASTHDARLGAIAGALNPVKGAVAIWTEGHDSYLFISDGTKGLTGGDVVIKLIGVEASKGIAIAGGDITLIE